MHLQKDELVPFGNPKNTTTMSSASAIGHNKWQIQGITFGKLIYLDIVQ